MFVVSSLFSSADRSVNDKFVQLLFFVDALKRASADRVTAVTPYLAYMRQDRKEASREPVSVQARARALEAVGVDRVLMMDAHNPGAEQCGFRIPVDILEAKKCLAAAMIDDLASEARYNDVVVLTPDLGGSKRAKAFQAYLAVMFRARGLEKPPSFAQADKTRYGSEDVSLRIIGDVRDKVVLVIDDMVATAKTAFEIERAVKEAGGYYFGLAATHGLFVGDAMSHLFTCPRVYVADTVDPWRVRKTPVRLVVVPTSGMFADAIDRIHSDDGSISELLTE